MANALSTDLYEITMAAGYVEAGLTDCASFELTVRSLPPHRSYLIAAGLEPALEYLEKFSFTANEIRYLRGLGMFKNVAAKFFDETLPSLRFTGEVWAMPEGTPVFPHEPIVRVTAPLVEAQLVETALLSTISFQTSVASRAARIVGAAGGRPVFEFGARCVSRARRLRGRLWWDINGGGGLAIRFASHWNDGTFLGDVF